MNKETVSEEQVLFNKLTYDDQVLIINIMKTLQPEKMEIPKRIQSNGENLYSEYIGQWLVNKENYTEYDELLMNKINEIIDYLKSKGNE